MFKKEKIKDLHYSVTGFISADDIQAAADEILTEYGKKAKMPGFRAGHIPLNVLRQKFNASAISESIDKLMDRDLNAYVAEKKIRLAGAPRADVAGWEIGKDLEYTLEFDILPTLPEIELEKITLTKKTTKLDEAEVEKAVENLRRARSVAEKQSADYIAQNGDTAVIDFKGFIGKDAFEGGEAKMHHLVLGSGSFIPGFEDQIIGHKADDKFDVNVKFPKEYFSADLAGKDATFKVKVHEIKKKELPELDDEFAKDVSEFDTIEELKKDIQEKLEKKNKDKEKYEKEEAVMEVVVDELDVLYTGSLPFST